MSKYISLPCLLLASTLSVGGVAWAQPAPTPLAVDNALHVVKSSVNAESDNAELCLEFDKTLAASPASHLVPDLHLTQDGKIVVPQNIVPTASSLCVFPLERGQPYQLSLSGLRGAQGERLAGPYTMSFTIPDRSPLLAFTGVNGGTGGFAAYESALTLRAINVAYAKIEIYRIADIPTMAHVWQDRAQTVLAPSESTYLARTKGQLAWSSGIDFDAAPNATSEQHLLLRDKVPDLAPGLYLIIADAGNGQESNSDKPANKGLAPLAAAWFTKSDFALQAVRDNDGIHVVASTAAAAKADMRLVAVNRQSEQTAETHSDSTGISGFAATIDANTIIGVDSIGNTAFADIKSLPDVAVQRMPGLINVADPFAVPVDNVNLTLSLAASGDAGSTVPGFVRLLRNQDFYGDFSVPALTKNTASLSFPAPLVPGAWNLRWQKNDGTILAAALLPVTANPDAPHLVVTTDSDALGTQTAPQMTVSAVTSTGKAAGLIGGHLTAVWQVRDPATLGWKNYHFGTQAAIVSPVTQSVDFLTGLDGTTQVKLNVPKPPTDPGLYQAAITTQADPDQGVADAPVMILPLRPDGVVIGIKPLAFDARFFQNSIARFALIGLSAGDKPRDVSGLSYQIYEEGRNFDWYQDDGRWNYKREPQLRPIGGGSIAIKADGNSILEWPVTAGNYSLEIIDSSGKIVAQQRFSAGWDSANGGAPAMALSVTLPKILEVGHEANAHFSLPAPAMVTILIADTHIRKIIHEFRPKGDNSIAFVPAQDWQNSISVSVETTAASTDGALTVMQGVAQTTLAQTIEADTANNASGVTLIAETNPAAILLPENGEATLNFGVANRGTGVEIFHYTFTASPGLKIESGSKGTFRLGARQSRSVPLWVSGDAVGAKEIKLEITGTRTPHTTRAWSITVASQKNYLRSADSVTVAPQQALIAASAKPRDAGVAFIARHSMQGLPEMLTFLFNAQPFTTHELAMSADALRLWNDTLVQAGIAPDFAVAARRQEWLAQLLQHQNSDGGFASARGGDSTMTDTASALIALGTDVSPVLAPAKSLAIAWLKQRLSNTWFDEKERTPRATAYAALAATDAIDPASLHYFSDISAQIPMTATAEADMAAAFKHSRDPNAAAFWIKKMLDEHGRDDDIGLLGALAATDALSSDDVHTALKKASDAMQANAAPELDDIATLLRALAADNVNVGKWRLATGTQTHDVHDITGGIYAVRLSDPTIPTLRNADAQPVSVTIATETTAPILTPPKTAEITRHIYKLNGTELSPQMKPAHGETYIVEMSGKAPTGNDGQQILLQDGVDTKISPIGCALSAKLEAPSFATWFTPHDLSPVASCEKSAYGINVVLAPAENDSTTFETAYFAHIDAKSTGALPPPRLRVIKN